MGGEIAFSGSVLVDSSGNKLAQAHESPWGQGPSVVVAPRSREESGPLCEECLSYPLLQGGIGVIHERQRWEGGVGKTRWELIMGILDSPRVKGVV